MFHRELGKLAAQGTRLEKLRQGSEQAALGDIRRHLQNEGAQHIGNGVDFIAIGIHIGGVLGRKLGDFGFGAPGSGEEIAAIGLGDEVRGAAFHHAQAFGGQIQISDDFGVEQAHRIGGHRIAETGVEFLRHRRTADHMAAFQHFHLQPRAGEIKGADEPVVAGPDDDGVKVLLCHGRGLAGTRP